jgi:SAM-dependent methyltransferase
MGEPAAWLVDNADLIPRGGTVLDVACGTGRNTLFLARHGWHVRAIDRDARALQDLLAAAGTLASAISVECVDLEAGWVSLGAQCYSAVIVFNYLHRPLLPAIVDAVAPGGVLIYETFTTGQARRGHPRNPAFLLTEGELPALVAPLSVVRAREGEFDGRLVASVVAMR